VAPQAGQAAPLVASAQVTTVEGLTRANEGTGTGQGFTPPDTNLAVNATQVLEVTNATVQVRSKSDLSCASPCLLQKTLNTFFAVPSGQSETDARVVWDAGASRWYISALVVANLAAPTGSTVLIAVSTTSDATGVWSFYSVISNSANLVYDQPTLGYSDDKVGMSFNDFDFTGTPTFTGTEIWVLQKSDLTSAAMTVRASSVAPSMNYVSVVPVQSLTSSAPLFMVSNLNLVSIAQLLIVKVTGTPANANVVFGTDGTPALTTAPPPPTRQPTGPTVDAGDDRLLSAVWRNNVLWTAGGDSCVPSGDSVARGCLRLMQYSTASHALLQSLDAGQAKFDLSFPGVTSDSRGNMLTVFSEASQANGIYPRVAMTAQASGAAGTFGPIAPLVPATGSVQHEFDGFVSETPPVRWGDYSGAAIDPDGTTAWLAGENVASAGGPCGSGTCNWGTAITNLSFVAYSGLGPYNPLPPKRIADTRCPSPDPVPAPYGCTTLPANGILTIQVTGGSGQPPADAIAAVLNITASNWNGGGHLRVYPAGTPLPNASNLNFSAGQTIANLVEVTLGTGGQVSIYNAVGVTDVIVDVEGYVGPEAAVGQGLFQPRTPARIVDTRSGAGSTRFPVGTTCAGSPPAGNQCLGTDYTLDVQVAGASSQTGELNVVPPTGAEAVVLNVTATGGTQDSYMTVWPADQPRPVASNLNFPVGRSVPNRVIVPLSTAGASGAGHIKIYNPYGFADVVVDVNGWFTDGSNPAATGGQYTALSPARIADSRPPPFNVSGFTRLIAGQTVTVPVAGLVGVPAMNAPRPPTSVVLNVTSISPDTNGNFTIYPSSVAQPLASDINFFAGQIVPNLVVVQLSPIGAIKIANSSAGGDDFIVDVAGFYS
jgi:hypothetical protein